MTDIESPEPTEELRLAALVAWLKEDGEDDIDADDLEPLTYDETTFELGNRSWMVMTEEEADDKTKEDIEEHLWAFNAWFLVAYLPEGVTQEVVEALQPQCENANTAIRSMVGDRFDELVEDAIAADGRGHFLNTYDGNEHEFECDSIDWLIYRVN